MDDVELTYGGTFSYLSLSGEDLSAVEREIKLDEALPAPVEQGQKAGILEYRLGENMIGHIDIVTKEAVAKAGYRDYLKRLAEAWRL